MGTLFYRGALTCQRANINFSVKLTQPNPHNWWRERGHISEEWHQKHACCCCCIFCPEVVEVEDLQQMVSTTAP